MTRVGIGSEADLNPAVEELVQGFEEARSRSTTPREGLVEALAAVAFLGVAVAMAAFVPYQSQLSVVGLVVFVAAYAAASRIRLGDGAGYTDATQLVLVPMLLSLPAAAVPLAVAAGLLLGRLPDYVSGKTHPARAVMTLGDSWHAVGPALVLGLGGAAGPEWADWPLYAAALAAQFGFDFAASTAREWLALGIPPKMQPRLLGWVYLVDLCLAPIGLFVAFAVADDPAAVLLLAPIAGLLAIFASERRDRIGNALELSQAYRGTTLLLSDVLDADDEYTGSHSRSVVGLALQVADDLRLDARQRREVEFAALLHDVGKIAIPKELVNKRGPLTPDEWVVMETHTVEGQRMLDRVGGALRDVGRVVRASHERWDGSGYPDGLAREEIPLAARIVACCDAFNAMTTDRPYRTAMSIEAALRELREGSGSQFDPRVVGVLVGLVGRPEPEASPLPPGVVLLHHPVALGEA